MPWETIFGGITGLIGSALTAIFNYKTKKIEFAHQVSLKELDIQLAEKEHEFALQQTSIEAEAVVEKAAEATLQASYAHDRATYFTPFAGVIEKYPWLGIPFAILFALIDALRGLIRPSMTVYMVILVTVMYLQGVRLLEAQGYEAIATDSAMIFVHRLIDLVIYLTATIMAWWFGDRTIHKRLAKGG
jgi:hypothetical protein